MSNDKRLDLSALTEAALKWYDSFQMAGFRNIAQFGANHMGIGEWYNAQNEEFQVPERVTLNDKLREAILQDRAISDAGDNLQERGLSILGCFRGVDCTENGVRYIIAHLKDTPRLINPYIRPEDICHDKRIELSILDAWDTCTTEYWRLAIYYYACREAGVTPNPGNWNNLLEVKN